MKVASHHYKVSMDNSSSELAPTKAAVSSFSLSSSSDSSPDLNKYNIKINNCPVSAPRFDAKKMTNSGWLHSLDQSVAETKDWDQSLIWTLNFSLSSGRRLAHPCSQPLWSDDGEMTWHDVQIYCLVFTHLLTSDIPTPLRVLYTVMQDITSLTTK